MLFNLTGELKPFAKSCVSRWIADAKIFIGNLMFDIDCLWGNYFNAQPVAGINSVDDSNFSLHAPYAGLKWIGQWPK